MMSIHLSRRVSARLLVGLLLVSVACRGGMRLPGGGADRASARTSSTADVVREMHERYSGRWYRTITFEQTNTFYTQSAGEQKSRWIQHVSVPGMMRIDFAPLSSKSGVLVVNNRVTTFDNGRRIDSRRSIQPLLTLKADVYAQPPSVTLRRLDSLGVDLSRFHENRWRGNRVYVLGAERGNLRSTQVWIDADRMLLVRLIQRERRGARTVVTDTQLRNYRIIQGYPVPTELIALRDGKRLFRETYSKVRVNQPIPPAAFDPARWTSAQPSEP